MASASNAERNQTIIWGLLLASSLLYFFSINDADNDLWGHVLFGREILASGAIPRVDQYSYTAAGQPWMNHEWLSQVMMAATYNAAGAPGLLVLKFVVMSATFLLLLAALRQRAATPSAWGAASLLSLAVLARGAAIRPQMFTYCGVALLLLLLAQHRRGRRGVLWCLPPLFLLWANLHGGFVLGLAILTLFACADVFSHRAISAQLWLPVLAAAALTGLNPNGFRLFAYIGNELSRAHPIGEWQPASISSPAQFAFFALLALFVCTLPFVRRWRENGWEVLLALVAALLAIRHQRHTPVFALCAAAPLAAQLEHAGSWLVQRREFALGAGARRLIGMGMLSLAVLQCVLVGLRVERDGLAIVFDPREYPTAAVHALRQAAVSVNLAVPLDWGEYVLWHLAPQVKVSLDGRFATVFPEAVVEDNFKLFSGAPGWQRLIEQYPTEAVLVPAGSLCPISSRPDWHLVYQDAVARLYADTKSAAWPKLERLSQLMAASPQSGVFP